MFNHKFHYHIEITHLKLDIEPKWQYTIYKASIIQCQKFFLCVCRTLNRFKNVLSSNILVNIIRCFVFIEKSYTTYTHLIVLTSIQYRYNYNQQYLRNVSITVKVLFYYIIFFIFYHFFKNFYQQIKSCIDMEDW